MQPITLNEDVCKLYIIQRDMRRGLWPIERLCVSPSWASKKG